MAELGPAQPQLVFKVSHITPIWKNNQIINDRQAAYLKGDSTVQQLLYMVHHIKKSWTEGNITQGVFLDVSAAFDKCWHAGIIAKLKQNKIDGKCLALFRRAKASCGCGWH